MASQATSAGGQLMMPIFISGSYPKELTMSAQVPLASTAIAERKQNRGQKRTKSASEPPAREGSKASSGSRPAGSSKPSPVSLRELVEQGYLKPGTNNVTVTYKGVVARASLLDNGQIQHEGTTYEVPGGFSLRVKRAQTPSKQSDDGWHAVHVNGVSLEDVRNKWLKDKGITPSAAAGGSDGGAAANASTGGSAEAAAVKKEEGAAAAAGEGDAAAAADAVKTEDGAAAAVKEEEGKETKPAIGLSAPPSSIYERQLPTGELPVLPSTYDALLPKDPEAGDGDGEGAEGEGEPDTSNWVQCSRCQTWRVVPDEFWPDIEAAGDEDWYCEEATWDLTLYDPFTKGCKEYAK